MAPPIRMRRRCGGESLPLWLDVSYNVWGLRGQPAHPGAIALGIRRSSPLGGSAHHGAQVGIPIAGENKGSQEALVAQRGDGPIEVSEALGTSLVQLPMRRLVGARHGDPLAVPEPATVTSSQCSLSTATIFCSPLCCIAIAMSQHLLLFCKHAQPCVGAGAVSTVAATGISWMQVNPGISSASSVRLPSTAVPSRGAGIPPEHPQWRPVLSASLLVLLGVRRLCFGLVALRGLRLRRASWPNPWAGGRGVAGDGLGIACGRAAPRF